MSTTILYIDQSEPKKGETKMKQLAIDREKSRMLPTREQNADEKLIVAVIRRFVMNIDEKDIIDMVDRFMKSKVYLQMKEEQPKDKPTPVTKELINQLQNDNPYPVDVFTEPSEADWKRAIGYYIFNPPKKKINENTTSYLILFVRDLSGTNFS